MDGLEIQFLLDPKSDLENAFSVYVDRLLTRLSPASTAQVPVKETP
jgi:hypothetical protein